MFGLFRPIPYGDLERGKDHDGAFVRVMARTGHSDHEESWKLETRNKKLHYSSPKPYLLLLYSLTI